MSSPIARKLDSCRRTLAIAHSRVRPRLEREPCIGYIGAQGFENLGDEVMFEAAASILKGRRLIPFREPWHERRLKRLGLGGRTLFESVVVGGGTLINPYGLHYVTEAARQGNLLWSIGTGVGSCGFRQPDNVELGDWRPLLSKFSHIGVRWPLSKARISGMGLSNVVVTGDLALAMAPEKIQPPSLTPSFALNVASPNESVPEERDHDGNFSRALEELHRLVLELVSAGWRVVPIAANSSDLAPLQAVLTGTPYEGSPIPVVRTFREFLDLVSGCRFTIGVRLHAAVLSCCAGVPPIMLSYREKCLDFMESMEMRKWCVRLDEERPGEITEMAGEMVSSCEGMRQAVHERSLRWKNTIMRFVEDVLGACSKGNNE